MPYNFYEVLPDSADRALAILVHWGQGNIIYLPYTSISPVYVTRDGKLVIYAGMVVIRARLGKPEAEKTRSLSSHASALAASVLMPSFDAPMERISPSAGETLPTDPHASPGASVGAGADTPRELPSNGPGPFPSVKSAFAAAAEPLADLDLLGAILKRQEPALGVTAPSADPAPAPGPPGLEPLVPPPAGTPAAAAVGQKPGTEQNLEQFAVDLRNHRVIALYHLPETGFFVELFQVTQQGEKPLEV